MLEYKTMDGKIFKGETAEDLATALWKSKFIPEPTLQDWMQESAKKAAMWDGTVVRTKDIETHIEDLIRFGFLKKV